MTGSIRTPPGWDVSLQDFGTHAFMDPLAHSLMSPLCFGTLAQRNIEHQICHIRKELLVDFFFRKNGKVGLLAKTTSALGEGGWA